MLTSLAANPFNHILRSETWACRRLQAHEGKIVCIRIPPLANLIMIVQANGELSQHSDGLEADTTLTILPALLTRLIARDETAYDSIEISGDAAFASDLITIGKHLRPHFEHDLSRIIGDIPAHRLTKAAESVFQWQLDTLKNFNDAMGEYWQEEQPIITKSNAIDNFAKQTAKLQHEVNLLEVRINRIIHKASSRY